MAFDVYSVIRSEEVRDHARKYWDLEPEDKVLLVSVALPKASGDPGTSRMENYQEDNLALSALRNCFG